MNRKFCFLALSSLFFALTSLYGEWSSQEIISTTPYNSTTPSIATSKNGDSVAVWLDELTGLAGKHGTLQGAVLPSGALNEQGQPAWELTSKISVGADNDPLVKNQVVGIDENGNAIVVWSQDHQIYVSRLLAGQKNWTVPQTINVPVDNQKPRFPFIAVAPNGNALVVWILNDSVFANTYDAKNDQWRGEQNIFGEA